MKSKAEIDEIIRSLRDQINQEGLEKTVQSIARKIDKSRRRLSRLIERADEQETIIKNTKKVLVFTESVHLILNHPGIDPDKRVEILSDFLGKGDDRDLPTCRLADYTVNEDISNLIEKLNSINGVYSAINEVSNNINDCNIIIEAYEYCKSKLEKKISMRTDDLLDLHIVHHTLKEANIDNLEDRLSILEINLSVTDSVKGDIDCDPFELGVS